MRSSTFCLSILFLLLSACGSQSLGPDTPSPSTSTGESVYRVHCAQCHSINGDSGQGPKFKGLYLSTVTLIDGSTVTADEAYLEESIKDPSKKIVTTFTNSMPQNFSSLLTAQEITNVIDFIKTLK